MSFWSLQFSGKNVNTGKITEVAGEDVVPISGKQVLDNHSVNLISSILTALFLPKIALAVGMWKADLQLQNVSSYFIQQYFNLFIAIYRNRIGIWLS